MDLWILLGFGIIVGLVMGAVISARIHREIMQELLRALGYDDQQKLRKLHDELAERVLKSRDPQPVIQVRLEQHQGTLFAYRADTEEFVGQGTDRQSLIDSMQHRFRGVRVEIVNGELLQKSHT